MAETKTKPNARTVAAFLASVSHPVRNADAEQIIALMTRITGEAPVMWGPSIIGFGSRHYRYESGHEGDICRIGFSPRSARLVFYILNGFPDQAGMLARLGKYKTSGGEGGCLYVNKLSDIDMSVLEAMITGAWAHFEGN